MSLSSALSATVAVFRRRPDDLLPAYFLTPAVGAIARVVTFVGVAVALLYLETTGRLARFREELATRDLDPPSPEAEPEAFAEWVESLVPLFELAFTPVVRDILVVTLVLTAVVFVFASVMVTAAQLAACYARLRGQRGMTAAVGGVRRYWLSILGARVLELVFWVLLSVGYIVVSAVVFAVSPVLAVFATLSGGFVWFIAIVAVRAVFAFVPVAIVVDENGVFAAVRTSAGYVRRNPFDAFGYYVLVVVSLFALAALAGVLGFIGGGVQLTVIVSFVLLAPALDLTKTALYGAQMGELSPPPRGDRSLGSQTVAGFRRGWREMVAFVRSKPWLHGFAFAFAVGGFAVGWTLAAPLEGIVTTSIAARIDGIVPPVAALDFATNNWVVAVSTAFAGIAVAVPAVVSLVFNGLVFGIYARTEAAPLELLAFVTPHGLIEIPALIIAGALGLSLGVSGWRTFRKQASADDLADAFERAFWVLVGVGILLAVAGGIEGFVSPFYWRPFL